MRLVKVGSKFHETFKTLVGKKFSGQIVDSSFVKDRPRGISDYVIRVGNASVVKAGDVITFGGFKHIIGDATSEMSSTTLFRFMRMLQVTHELPWVRTIPVQDAVTGLTKSEDNQPLGTAYCAILLDGVIDDVFKVQTSKFRLFTPSALCLNDRVGPYVVTFVEQRYGITHAEVR